MNPTYTAKHISINVIKKADLTKVFGSLKGRIKISGQKLKDMAREGWES